MNKLITILSKIIAIIIYRFKLCNDARVKNERVYARHRALIPFWEKAVQANDEKMILFIEQALENPEDYHIFRVINKVIMVLRHTPTNQQ